MSTTPESNMSQAIYDAVDVDVVFEVVPYARCKKHTETREVVGCFNVAKNPEFENAIMFSEIPLFFAYISYFHNTENQPMMFFMGCWLA